MADVARQTNFVVTREARGVLLAGLSAAARRQANAGQLESGRPWEQRIPGLRITYYPDESMIPRTRL